MFQTGVGCSPPVEEQDRFSRVNHRSFLVLRSARLQSRVRKALPASKASKRRAQRHQVFQFTFIFIFIVLSTIVKRKNRIGRRIRLSRTAVGLSLRALAAKIDNRVTAQAIGKYEHGESMPSTGVLTALADALGVSTTYLTGSRDMTLEAVEFRRKTLAGKREEDQIKARVLRLLERYLAVEELLGLTSASWDKPRGSPWPVLHDLSEVEHAARGLRAHWGLGFDPIPNLGELLEERGVKVLTMDLTAIDGLAVRVRREDGSITPVIVVNQGHWGERQRFTLAHELGHIVLDVAPKIDGENAAHRFAAALLMPAEPLRAEVGRRRKSIGWGELIELKRIFGISVQALTLRCEELCIFSPTLSRRLFDEFIRRGWRRPPYQEPYAMVGEKPRRFERLVCRALSEGAVSADEAAELLEIPVRDLNLLMEEPDPKRIDSEAGTPLLQGPFRMP
ncbi:MAG: ImmA/IrrE family metallo-endopeptidase [Bryobacterales bacterium]|nr:ImmA/IrrE family metallo-endopeptidase [Bryobacterales bacterium]